MNFSVGSEWRKWDLHVHTPCSIVQNYGGNTEAAWEAFLKNLEDLPEDFKVIGINDYIFVDGYERVLKEKASGRLKNIELILPVVELRLDKFAGTVRKADDGTYSRSDWNRINLHIIFDQISPELIRQQFLSSLVQCYDLIPDANHFRGKWQAVVTPDSLEKLGKMVIDSVPEAQKPNYGSPLQEGFNNLCFSLDKVLDALEKHDLKNRFILAVGKTEWENMKWTDQSIAEKKNVINRVDLVFTASVNPQAYDAARAKLTDANVLDKLLDCSDAHNFSSADCKDKLGQCFTWIKANPSFEGLLQAVTEFDQRVYVGDTPPKRLLVSSNRTKYASSVSIKKKADSSLTDTWFDVEIPLNSDLVAIIGNKGSGKSALADVIALVGDTRNHDQFSFLNERRFCDPRTKLAGNFLGSIHWKDATDGSKYLHETPAPSSVERIKYLPQRYLETLCNELSGSGSSTFDHELRKIIYTHVPEEQRIGFRSLDELLAFKVSELEHERRQFLDRLVKLNVEYVQLERRLSPQFRATLEQQLEAKRREFDALDGARPIPVEDPQASEDARREAAEAGERLAIHEVVLADIRTAEQAARSKRVDALKRSAHLTKIIQSVKNQQNNHAKFIVELDLMLTDAGVEIKASEIVKFNIDLTRIDSLSAACKAEADEQDAILSSTSDSGLMRRRDAAESAIREIKGKLGERQRLFLVYKEQLEHWERSKAELQGSADKVDSIAWYLAEIETLQAVPAIRDALKAERLEVVRLLHEQLGKVVAEYRDLYRPVQNFVQSSERMDMPLPLSFDVRITEDGFLEAFLGRINRQSRGSFAGIEESNALVRRLLKERDFASVDDVVAFVNLVDEMLHFDKRVDAAKSVDVLVDDQLRKGITSEDVYDYIFGLEYLRPRYSLTYDQQEISQLSPGERGLLLLVFYLLVDKDDIPLVIDQPEENLDNQTIYKILVRCIKAAKQRRQVIMVTHNPNLAVVCDAEQIICATCDKPNKTISYISGAIEDPEIRSRVIEILEGTEPAFVNRKRKYGL